MRRAVAICQLRSHIRLPRSISQFQQMYLSGSAGSGCVKEACEVGFTDRRLAGSDVIQLSRQHPLFQIADQMEEVVEGIDDEKQRLVMIDLERLIDRPF